MGCVNKIIHNTIRQCLNEISHRTLQNAAQSAYDREDDRVKKFRDAAYATFDRDERPYLGTYKRGDFDNDAFQRQNANKKITFFDNNYKSLKDMYDCVKRGQLLIHSRKMQGEPSSDMRWIYPTFDETMQEFYGGDYEEAEMEPAEMIFASDDFSWAKDTRNGVFFVYSDNFAKYLGNNVCQLPNGTICRYFDTPLYDYDDVRFQDVPHGVETGDWFSKDEAEVAAILNLN